MFVIIKVGLIVLFFFNLSYSLFFFLIRRLMWLVSQDRSDFRILIILFGICILAKFVICSVKLFAYISISYFFYFVPIRFP